MAKPGRTSASGSAACSRSFIASTSVACASCASISRGRKSPTFANKCSGGVGLASSSNCAFVSFSTAQQDSNPSPGVEFKSLSLAKRSAAATAADAHLSDFYAEYQRRYTRSWTC
eukprot:4804515-Amphidinium_carterae.2